MYASSFTARSNFKHEFVRKLRFAFRVVGLSLAGSFNKLAVCNVLFLIKKNARHLDQHSSCACFNALEIRDRPYQPVVTNTWRDFCCLCNLQINCGSDVKNR